jgi:DegV family protein with EDD domain
MTSTVAVIADSAASLPAALAHKWGVRVVPLSIVVGGVARAEDHDESPARVLADLQSGAAVTTSQPGIEAFRQEYQRAADAGAPGAVVVTIASQLSGTYANAVVASEGAPIPVRVVDSRTMAMAAGFAAIAAASIAREGGSMDDVCAEAERVASGSVCLFTVDTLEYLKRGGRISPAVAAVGNALGVRPVLEIVDGEVRVVDRMRGTTRARVAVMSRIAVAMGTMERPAAAVMALGDQDFGDHAARSLERDVPELGLLVRTPVSAVLAVHTGPGTLAAVAADLPPGVF